MRMTYLLYPSTEEKYAVIRGWNSIDKIVDSEETSKDVIVDYNSKDEVVAIEVLNVKNSEHTIDLSFVLKSAWSQFLCRSFKIYQ